MWPAAYDILPTIARPSKAIPQVQPDIRSPINGYVRGPRDPHHRGHPRDPELPWVPSNLKFGWPASARRERESSRGWACIRTPPLAARYPTLALRTHVGRAGARVHAGVPSEGGDPGATNVPVPGRADVRGGRA